MDEVQETDADAETDAGLPLRFELPKSFLSVRGMALEKRNSDGVLVAVHQLDSISQVRVTRGLDYFALAMGVAGGAMSYCGWRYIESAGWSWAVAILGALIAIFFLVAANQTRLEIQCAGEVVRYTLLDEDEHCHGFCLTLKQELMPENLKKRRAAD